ncbi:hypothetical protein Enr17x_49470 [Gimesia fumaroli]|uniref:Uncharacterized protein n=1 Tax=Gimesia fumaroli TaxID=2527976 RepID=A0A518IIG2_9PLAN|nr:hypothetical protein Enr17x_49470 [Gimesia fumaroli]
MCGTVGLPNSEIRQVQRLKKGSGFHFKKPDPFSVSEM